VNRALDDERAEKNQSSGKTVSVAGNSLMNGMEKPSQNNSSSNRENNEDFKRSGFSDDQGFKLNDSESKSSEDILSDKFRLDEKEFEDDRRQTISKGKQLPFAKELRDTEKDANPIEEEDLGLPDDSFLIKRKVSRKDLILQNETQEKQFLGANVRKLRDFVSIFDKGLSSKNNPKIDLNYEITQNPKLRKELIAQQLIRNYKSKNELEQRNTKSIFKELNLLEEEDFKDKIDSEADIYNDDKLISKITSKLPNL
jgi:hypothetical protein